MTNLNDDQSTTTAPSASITNPITRCLMQTCKKLIDPDASAFYLGDPARTFKYNVMRKCVGNGNRLVTKESAKAVDKTDSEEAQAADSDNDPSQTTDTTSRVLTDTLFELAILSAIVFINFDDCWLTPCGFWKGPTSVTKKFEDLKLSFLGKAPNKDFLSQDFSTIVQNAKTLMDETSLAGAKSSGFLVTTKKGEDAIQLC